MTMYRIERQVNDERGAHRWQPLPGRYPTPEAAEKAMHDAAEASLEGPHPEGYRSTRFRTVPVKAAPVVCAGLQ